MTSRRAARLSVLALVVGLMVWGTMRGLEYLMSPRPASGTSVADAGAPSMAHITATLFYASQDGETLHAIKRDVPLAEGTVAQGREIVIAQLMPPPAPYLPVIPAGTTLRAFYVTDRGDAFVDVSGHITRGHSGGSLAELLTVYAIVNAVTTNLPAVRRVQILVDGTEVDTIAGHVDVRRPLEQNASLIHGPTTP